MTESLFFRPISRSSSVPLHAQVRDALLKAITSGRLPEDSLLPSEPALCKMFGVSRASLRQALLELARQGLLRREQGRGTFVARSTPQMMLPLTRGLTEAMTPLGVRVSSLVRQVEIVEADEVVAQNLACPEGTPVFRIARLRLLNDEPLRSDEVFILQRLCPGLEAMDLSQSLRDILRRKYHLRVSGGTYRIKPILANEEEARELGVQVGDPLLLARGVDRDQHDYPFLDTRSVYRCDRFEFVAETSY